MNAFFEHLHRKTEKQGFASLVSVLIVGLVGSSIASLLLFTSIDQAQVGTAYTASALARFYAQACAEEALEQVRAASFIGTASLAFDQGTCTYTVTNTGGTTRQILTSGLVSGYIRRIRISISALRPMIILTEWMEIP